MIKLIREKIKKSAYWSDILWQASGNSLAQLIGISAIPIFTRLYSPTEFGTFGLFTQIVSFLSIIMTWRYEYFLHMPRDNYNSDLLIKLIIYLGALTFLTITPIIYIFRYNIAYILGDVSLSPWLTLSPLAAILTSVSIAIQYKIQRQEDYKSSGLSEVYNKLSYAITGILGALIFSNAAGLIFAFILGTLSKIIWLKSQTSKITFFAKENLIDLYAIKKLAFSYLRLSSSLVVSHIMLTLTTSIPLFLIVKMYGNETLGNFTLVVSTLYLPTSLVGNAIGQVYYQRAAKCRSNGQNFNDLWQSTAKHLLVIGTPLYGAIGFLAPLMYPIIFGKAWIVAGEYASLLSIGAFFSFVTSPLDKASLVVNAWWYLPCWHTTRALTTGLVAWLTWNNQWSSDVFLNLLIIQMTFMYLIDYYAEWRFSL